MQFLPTEIDGVVIVELEPRGDDRGFFARAFCQVEFAEAGLVSPLEQANLAYTQQAGTVRGIHWQEGEAAEAKFTRCLSGSIVDVAVDVRPDSPTYLQHVMVELSAENRRALYIAPGLARAYQTLEADTEVFYQVSAPYTPAAERGLRPTDPALGIEWPHEITELSDKDASWDLLD
ncbi:MAG: dTDP-4-dehydrorhamnose 3,5-epimerase family protein [Acidimicrobiales bacterium]